MNDQQLDNLIAYMKSIAITPEEAQEQAAERAQAELERLEGLEGASDDESYQEPSLGAALFNVSCARCHTLGWSYGEPQIPGGGAFGPSLYNSVNQFPEVEEQEGFVSEGAQNGERYGLNGQSNGRMPYFSQVLTTEQIAAIVEYERSLNERQRNDAGSGPPAEQPEDAGEGEEQQSTSQAGASGEDQDGTATQGTGGDAGAGGAQGEDADQGEEQS
jgi:mono/diheme cytochrome c family protein